jgi:3',5'-cyclic AMP phosphodiesterase CpdA
MTPSLTIAHIGDPQFGFNLKGEDPETKYSEDLARMERVIEEVNCLKPDVALISGDMTHRVADIVRDWPRLLSMFKVPVIATPGNHDMCQRLEREALDNYNAIFGPDYGTMDVNGWRIIFGNTQYWLETDEKDAQSRYEEWLAAELERAKALHGKIILAGHNAPFAYTPEEPDGYENCPKTCRFARLDAYLAAGARFYLAGHMHRLSMRGWRGLTILSAEALSYNFDQRPFGFRLFQVADDFSFSWDFRAI